MFGAHPPASEFDAIAGIHRGLTRQTTSLLTKYAGTHGVIIGVFLPEDEFRRGVGPLRRDLLMFRKFGLAANTGIRRIANTYVA